MILPSASRLPSMMYPPSLPATCTQCKVRQCQIRETTKSTRILMLTNPCRNHTLPVPLLVKQGLQHRLMVYCRDKQPVQPILQNKQMRPESTLNVSKTSHSVPSSLSSVLKSAEGGSASSSTAGPRTGLRGPSLFQRKRMTLVTLPSYISCLLFPQLRSHVSMDSIDISQMPGLAPLVSASNSSPSPFVCSRSPTTNIPGPRTCRTFQENRRPDPQDKKRALADVPQRSARSFSR